MSVDLDIIEAKIADGLLSCLGSLRRVEAERDTLRAQLAERTAELAKWKVDYEECERGGNAWALDAARAQHDARSLRNELIRARCAARAWKAYAKVEREQRKQGDQTIAMFVIEKTKGGE